MKIPILVLFLFLILFLSYSLSYVGPLATTYCSERSLTVTTSEYGINSWKDENASVFQRADSFSVLVFGFGSGS